MPSAYPQDGHAHIHSQSHLQPGNSQGYYQQHPHVLHKQPSPHLMPPPPSPLPLDPTLVNQQLHSSAQGYGYPPGFNQPHQRAPQVQFPMNQQFPPSQEPEDGSDENKEDGESDEEPAVNNGKDNKKRTRTTSGSPAKKHKQNEGQDDKAEDSGTPLSAVAPKLKLTRGSRACTNCRRSKMKCAGADKDLEGKCDRCRTNNRECHFEESNRGKKPSKKQENLMRDLKRMENTLDTLMHSISHPGPNSLPTGTVTRSPTPSSPSVQALMGSPSASTPDMTNTSDSSLHNPRENPRSNSPHLHILPDNVTKIRKPPINNSATLQHGMVSPVPNSRGIVHPSKMSIHEMFEYLIHIGCPDLTQFVDPNEYSRNSVATGGFGDIFKGKLNDATPVAIKVWRYRALNEELGKAGKRAMREIYNWSQLEHENIQKLLGVVVFDGRLGMVSKWMEWGNLHDYLQKNSRVDGYPLCAQIAQGVEYLHSKNMIHGDLKAINILVSSDYKLKLTDFDYSILAESTVFSQTTRPGGGTLRWMAPELALDLNGDQQRNKRTDIYALGMTFLETTSRVLPYFPQCKTDGSVLNAISQKRFPQRDLSFFGSDRRGSRMWALLLRCWDHDPAARPIAAEVTALLQKLIRPRETEPGNTVEPLDYNTDGCIS